jgi:hypothetical protein
MSKLNSDIEYRKYISDLIEFYSSSSTTSFYLPNTIYEIAYYYAFTFLPTLSNYTTKNYSQFTNTTDSTNNQNFAVMIQKEKSYNFLIVQGGGDGGLITNYEQKYVCGGGGGFVSYGTLINDSNEDIVLNIQVGGGGGK